MTWALMVFTLSAVGGSWHGVGYHRTTTEDIPTSLAPARETFSSTKLWTPAHPTAGYSRDRLLTERGHPLGLGLEGILGLLTLTPGALEPQPTPQWEDAWLASDDDTEIYFHQTGSLRTRTDGDEVYVFVEARYWGLLNGVPYSNEPFQELWCLEQNLITYREGRAQTMLRRGECRSAYPRYTDAQWEARKTLMKPDWALVEHALEGSYHESLFVFGYSEQGTLIQVDEFSRLERPTPWRASYEYR